VGFNVFSENRASASAHNINEGKNITDVGGGRSG